MKKLQILWIALIAIVLSACGGSGSSSSGGPSHCVAIHFASCAGIWALPLEASIDGRPFDGGLARDGDVLSERVSQGVHVFRFTDRHGQVILQNTPFIGEDKRFVVNCRAQPLWE